MIIVVFPPPIEFEVSDEDFKNDVFDADAKNRDRIQVTRDEWGALKITKAMNGYGTNNLCEYEGTTIKTHNNEQ